MNNETKTETKVPIVKMTKQEALDDAYIELSALARAANSWYLDNYIVLGLENDPTIVKVCEAVLAIQENTSVIRDLLLKA